MAKVHDLKISVSVDARAINPSATAADKFDIPVKIRHNHDNPATPIPVKVFVQDVPLGMIDATDDVTETYSVKPDRSKAFKVKIQRAGTKEYDEVEIPWDVFGLAPVVAKKDKPDAKDKPPDIEAEASMDPDADGDFAVTIITREGGVYKGRRFRATCTNGYHYQLLDQNKTPLVAQLETPANGILTGFVRFAPIVATFRFILENGQEAVAQFAK